MSGGPRFLTDAMLGGLTRWLRVLGFDALYNPAADDRELVRIANESERVLLTRDRHLITFLRPTQGLLIQADAPLEQLQQVVLALAPPPPNELFTRCLTCNCELVAASAAVTVPDAKPPFRQCPACDRVFWQGSHTRRMRATLKQEFPEWLGHL